jgi:hypothetical protein
MRPPRAGAIAIGTEAAGFVSGPNFDVVAGRPIEGVVQKYRDAADTTPVSRPSRPTPPFTVRKR